MRIKKRTIIFAMAAMLTVLLLNGCGKDRDPSQTDGAGKTQTTEQGSDAAAPNETEEEKIARLETELTELGSIEKAEITKERSGYRVTITLQEGKYNMDEELRDVIITKLTTSYEDLKDDEIEIEVQEREEN